jgi:hypothetical protein
VLPYLGLQRFLIKHGYETQAKIHDSKKQNRIEGHREISRVLKL